MDYTGFKQAIFSLTGIDLNLYKEKQMKRRIDALIDRKSYEGYGNFVALLAKDRNALDYFLDYITINVTQFFRTPDQWQQMEEEVLPHLTGGARIWSVACCTGEEPYSLVMSLSKYLPLSDIHVIATDINERVLNFARRGLYPETALAHVPDNFRDQFFTKSGLGFSISDEVRRCVEFQKLNLLSDPYPRELDLIVCRNVLIYFTDEGKQLTIRQFRDSLKPGGYLFTGNTEQLLQYRDFHLSKHYNFLYSAC